MSKEVYVRDAVESCADCKFCIEICEGGLEACCEIMTCENNKSLYRTINDYCQRKPDWCPFKPMPEKKERPFIPYNHSDGYSHGYVAGWNCCVDEISREE